MPHRGSGPSSRPTLVIWPVLFMILMSFGALRCDGACSSPSAVPTDSLPEIVVERNINEACTYVVECPSGTSGLLELKLGLTLNGGSEMVVVDGEGDDFTLSESRTYTAYRRDRTTLRYVPGNAPSNLNIKAQCHTDDAGFFGCRENASIVIPQGGTVTLGSDVDGSGDARVATGKTCGYTLSCANPAEYVHFSKGVGTIPKAAVLSTRGEGDPEWGSITSDSDVIMTVMEHPIAQRVEV